MLLFRGSTNIFQTQLNIKIFIFKNNFTKLNSPFLIYITLIRTSDYYF